MNFEVFMQQLDESLKRTVPIRWQESTTRDIGRFTVAGNFYEIIITKLTKVASHLSVAFTGEDENGEQGFHANGKGNELVVLATVISGIKVAVDKYDPVSLSFVAGNDVASRKKLYDRMVKKFAKEEEYEFTIVGNEYRLIRPNSKSGDILQDMSGVDDAMLNLTTADSEIIMAVGFDSNEVTREESTNLARYPNLYSFTVKSQGQTWVDVDTPDGEQPTLEHIKTTLSNQGLSSLIPKIKYYAN